MSSLVECLPVILGIQVRSAVGYKVLLSLCLTWYTPYGDDHEDKDDDDMMVMMMMKLT